MNTKISKTRIILPVILAIAVVAGAGYGWHHLNTQMNNLNTQLVSEKKTSEETEKQFAAEKEELTNKVTELEKELQDRDSRLSSRDGFLASIEGMSNALSSAEGKVDTAAAKQLTHEAQEAVLLAKNADEINQQIEKLKTATQELEAAVAAYVPPVARQSTPSRSSASNNASGPSSNSGSSNSGSSNGGAAAPAPSGDPLANAREALNRVGGGWVTLTMNECTNPQAAACAMSGKVSIAGQYASQPVDWWYHIMMHEYAHQIQFQNWVAMARSATYQNLMNSDVEWLAECMARARIGDGYRTGRTNYSCTADQIAYGSRAWSGDFS